MSPGCATQYLDCCPGTRIRRRETEDDGFEKAELELGTRKRRRRGGVASPIIPKPLRLHPPQTLTHHRQQKSREHCCVRVRNSSSHLQNESKEEGGRFNCTESGSGIAGARWMVSVRFLPCSVVSVST